MLVFALPLCFRYVLLCALLGFVCSETLVRVIWCETYATLSLQYHYLCLYLAYELHAYPVKLAYELHAYPVKLSLLLSFTPLRWLVSKM